MLPLATRLAVVGKVTDVAKEIVAAYYGKPADHSYFVGCSTGGREAMIASQRYPNAFDGIVAGAPAMRTGFSNIGIRWVAVSLSHAAQKDEHGAVVPGSALSATDKQLIVEKVTKACDANDGLEDGLIFAPAECRFDPADLLCKGEKTAQCLSAPQIDAVRRAMSGPVDANGDQVYPGYFYDTGIAVSARGAIPGVLNGASSPVDPPTPHEPGRRRRGDRGRHRALRARRYAGLDQLEYV